MRRRRQSDRWRLDRQTGLGIPIDWSAIVEQLERGTSVDEGRS